MSQGARRILVLLAAAAVARGALHWATFGLPVSNDDAILLLMARAVLRGELATTLWNQPYNGALDAYLLAPLVAVLPHHTAYRLYQLVCAGLLVWLVFLLGRRLGGERAAAAGALAAAWGTPYMGLMTATGPPPNYLMPLATGFPLLLALDALAGSGAAPARAGVVLASGLACGLAVWNSALAIPALVGMGAGLVLAGLRPRTGRAVRFGAGLAIGLLPLAVSRLIGAAGTEVQTASSAVTALRPQWLWLQGLRDLGHALAGLVGLQLPLVVDGSERAALPRVLAVLLVVALVLTVVAGCRTRRVWPLVGWIGALAAAFWLSRRTGPDDLRYLYGICPPLLALVGTGLASLAERRRAAAIAAGMALALAWGAGTWQLARVWANPEHAELVWQVPALDAPIAALRAQGVRSAYASLQFAGRLTLETRGELVASQAWNERIPGDPLRFRDEVDLDPAAAWVLSNRLSRGMPRALGFRERMHELGGSCEETAAGSFVVFHGFRPPFDETRPVPRAAIQAATLDGQRLGPAAFDRDPATSWISTAGLARGSGLVVRVTPARRLAALALAVDLEASPLAVPWVVSIAGEVVAQGPARAGLQWVNGVPRAGRQALLVAPLGGRSTEELRLVFQGPGPRLVVGEVFLYGPDEAEWARAGEEPARSALELARAGRWEEAVRSYAAALRLEPERASLHAGWARARWRAAGRRILDVESLTDGGPELVDVR